MNAPACVTGRVCEVQPPPVAWVLRPPLSSEDPGPSPGAALLGACGCSTPLQVLRARPLQRSLLMVVGPRREGGPGVVSVGCRPVPQPGGLALSNCSLFRDRGAEGQPPPPALSVCRQCSVLCSTGQTSGTWHGGPGRERVGVLLGSHSRHFTWVPTQWQARSPATWPPAWRTWGRSCSFL